MGDDAFMRVACQIDITEDDRAVLQKWSRGRSTPARLVFRAKVVLLADEGKTNQEIAVLLKTKRSTVSRWRERFAKQGLVGLEKDAEGRGRKPTVRNEIASEIVEKTIQSKPQNATHWSCRSLAESLGTSFSMVARVWRANGLRPHLVRTFKLSNDPKFLDKMVDVVGLYLNPPEHALVLCADEKSQIQALDRTQKSLPLIRGRCGTMTHDYKRNGTTTLFAAIDMAEGRIIGTCMKRHRHQEWIKFLRVIDSETSPDLDLHLIVDNYATHKHPKVKSWLKHHPRFHIHFIPTSSSWLNMIERWFREITDKTIRRGVFRSVDDLVKAILSHIDGHNANPKPFVWTAKASKIWQKVCRARNALEKTPSV